MAKGDIETYHEDDVWKNRAEGGQRASNTAETKAEAQATGRQMALDRGVEHQEARRHHRRAQHLSAQPRQESTQGIAIDRARRCFDRYFGAQCPSRGRAHRDSRPGSAG
jgi:hypothetical protein